MSEQIKEATATSGRPMIYQCIIDVMRAVGAVGKNKVNQGQRYNFRGIDDMYNALHEPLAAAGVFATPRVLSREREERKSTNGGTLIYTILDVEHTFYALDGSNIAVVTTGEAMDSGDKSCNKAMSAAYKYALMELFCIPTEEKLDTEYENHEVAPREAHTPAPQRTQRREQAPRNAGGKASKPMPMQQLMAKCEAAGLCCDAEGRVIVAQIQEVLREAGHPPVITEQNLESAFNCITEPVRKRN